MIPFLKTVALHYRKEVEANGPMALADCLFVFPSRRSGLFFTKYLGEGLSRPLAVPRTITIGDLFGSMSALHVADRTTLLFRLFDIYRHVSAREDRDEFDQFVFWGDMLISDFDDVDKYLVDAEKLFSNVSDLKEIEARFSGFDDETIRIIQSFWRNVRLPESGDISDPKRRTFYETWSILYQLYTRFRESLLSEGLAYEGMLEREVVTQGCCLPNNPRKVVFVGLTAINQCERRLMLNLKLEGKAEFCWDYADARLQPDSVITSAAFFTKHNLADFPNALSDDELQAGLVPDDRRHFQLYGVPSGVGQTNVARERLLELGNQGMDTAIVLADEKLLLPVLYSIPQDWGEFNVTMGYSLRRTPIHAEVQSLIGKDRSSSFHQAYQKVVELLDSQDPKIPKSQDPEIPDTSDVNAEFRACYRETVERLYLEACRHNIPFTGKTFFTLLQKLVNGVSVPFSGEPLRGIQVMGMLETRALDFRNVIMLSANEGILPAKASGNSFVPMSLRRAFRMPTQQHKDAVFAYHFYRLMSRAEQVTLIYDSRTEGTQTGEESRYIKQMRYLLGRKDLESRTVSHRISIPQVQPCVVHKTPEVMAELQAFLNSDQKRLSPSALKAYVQCPLKFYLSYVRGLKGEDEKDDVVDSLSFGNILHAVMQRIYHRSIGTVVQANVLTPYIDDARKNIHPLVCDAMMREMNVPAIEGYNIIVAGTLTRFVRQILIHDRAMTPFRYIASERPFRVKYYFDDQEHYVTFKSVIDRIDSKDGQVRIVDYKSGKSNNGSKLAFKDVDYLFSSFELVEALQVMLYCKFLTVEGSDLSDVDSYAPHLYFVSDFRRDKRTRTDVNFAGTPVVYSRFDKDFTNQLNALLNRIFLSDEPFTQCQDNKACTFCDFLDICKRQPKQFR